MLTDYYAVWQPTKVNTGASFNLLQAHRFPRWAQLRCTYIAGSLFLQLGIFLSQSPCRELGGYAPTRLSEGQPLQQGERPREGTWRKMDNTWCFLSPLPSILFITTAKDPQAPTLQAIAICQHRPLSQSPDTGAGSADERAWPGDSPSAQQSHQRTDGDMSSFNTQTLNEKTSN